MVYRLLLAGVCTGLVLALPLPAVARPLPADDKTAAKTDKTADTSDKTLPSKKDLVKAGEISGKVVKVDATERTITIQISGPNPEVVRAIGELQRQLAAQFYSTNSNRAQQIADLQAQIAQQKENLHKVSFQALDDVKVRTAQPPTQYDDKGNPKKLTSYELRALRGNSWGYASDFDSLKNDQVVTIQFMRKKDKKTTTYQPRSQDTKKDATAPTPPEPHYAAEIHIVKDTDR
jgi:hypothetical protein